MKKEDTEEESVSSHREKDFACVAPLIHKVISRKLGSRHRDWVEDLKQKVFLKLWRWKEDHKFEDDLTEEEWRKLANVAAHNEVTDFFREKYIRDVPFSQMNDAMQQEITEIESYEVLAGNSKPEICSLLKLVWRAAQKLTLRQKYAYFLPFSDFIVEFILCECCSIEELAFYFEVSESKLSEIIDRLPLSEENIGKLLEAKLGGKIAPKQIWEARSKAKARLAAALRDSVFNERSSITKRD